MTPPNMAAITESLERSFQNCSLNHHRTGTLAAAAAAAAAASTERSSSSDVSDQSHNPLIHSSSSSSDSTVELNSHVSMPYDWEQCLDLKTGEIYYMNWKNGMRAKHDPRLLLTQDLLMSRDHDYNNYNYYYSDEDEDDDSSSCDSEESSSESSPCSSRDNFNNNSSMIKIVEDEDVLVVAGCKRCLMYYMLPKKVDNCPQCRASHLIHFDRSSDNNNNTA